MRHFITLLALGLTLNAEILLPENFTTNFQQTITNDKGKVIKYEGNVIFQNLNQSLFKWSYTAPTQKEVCTNGVQLIVVDHDLEQVSTYLMDDGINLEEILKLAKPISMTDYQATYRDIEYLISTDANKQLKKIVYVDDLDNKVKIIFNKMNYNTKVSIRDLECNAPQAYDIIKG